MHSGDAGLDLCSIASHVLRPGEIATVATGIAMATPRDCVGLIWDRSGLAIKNGLKVLGGVIDSNYRGEIIVGLINLSKKTYRIEAGDRIAQMLIQKVENVSPQVVSELTSSNRGDKGFGSSGRK